MTRIAGILVGVVWLVFTLMALNQAAGGRAQDQPDVAFWWTVAAIFLGIATAVVFVGTIRYRYEGPRK